MGSCAHALFNFLISEGTFEEKTPENIERLQQAEAQLEVLQNRLDNEENANEDTDLVSDIEVLLQGQWPKRRLMERFRQGSDGGAPGCVLVASASFWEGFDVPGQALQLLVIDKLPFPSPGDPLVKARGNRLQAQGKNAFSDHSLPEAIVALKQGAGRLIRHETDRGGLLIADNRLLSASYGRRILAALPLMQQIDQTEDFWDALVNITTASTKAS